LGSVFKRRLRKIHNPLYPPYLKGDDEGESVLILKGILKLRKRVFNLKGHVTEENAYLRG